MKLESLTITTTCLFFVQLVRVSGHGRLMDPPARNSMWRQGLPNPVNYNDNELFCGGQAVQYQQYGGKCGVCGDSYGLSEPRPHEAGGQYARGVIGRHYTMGQDITVEIDLTANHKGRFEMFLCPNNNPRYEASQPCFDRFPLFVSGTRQVRYFIPENSRKKETFTYKVRLPPYVTCSQCVLQWTYYTGNMWGRCANGTEGLGCGEPETFRNCADIAIVTSTLGLPPQFVNSVDDPFLFKLSKLQAPQLPFPMVVRSQICVATPQYQRVPGLNDWCQLNCLNFPPYCPQNVCYCPNNCDAIGELAGRAGADEYCLDQCIVYPTRCPARRCQCYEEKGSEQ